MNEVQSWFEIAKYVGAGGAFVLGIGVWKVWTAFQIELSYSKARDRETLNVLAALTAVIKDESITDARHEDKILSAINELKAIVVAHFGKFDKHE